MGNCNFVGCCDGYDNLPHISLGFEITVTHHFY